VAAPERLTFGALNASQEREPIKMTFGDVFEIQDLRSHSAGTVMRLAFLLAGTVEVTPDPKRKNFYEVIGGSDVYYIHVSPVTGIIYLLAVWRNAVTRATLSPKIPYSQIASLPARIRSQIEGPDGYGFYEGSRVRPNQEPFVLHRESFPGTEKQS